jgi:predicted O-methyltransferase YrrM
VSFENVELVSEHRANVLRKIDSVPGEPEMTNFESSFLAGLIKKFKPKKVVEIGVAAGGTTAIILDSLETYSTNYKFYSLDLSADFYRDKNRSTGFLALQYIEKTPLLQGSHELITGMYAPESIDYIGDSIDFIIIDTVHVLPGEILDFLAFYPNLSDEALIVLHDITLNHGTDSRPNRSYATKLLFDVVDAKKYMNFDESEGVLLPNIAAFQLNVNTKNSIVNIISSLTITWEYFPEERELEIYNNIITTKYEASVKQIWDAVIFQQKKSMRPKDYKRRLYIISVRRNSYLYWIHKFDLTIKHLFKYGPIITINKLLEIFRHFKDT